MDFFVKKSLGNRVVLCLVRYDLEMNMLEYSFKMIERYLRFGYISSAGRNFTGIICVHHRGGGTKKRGYKVDFYRRLNCLGFLVKILKTSVFTGFLGLVLYQNGLINYILLSENIQVGARIFSGNVNQNDENINYFTIGSSLPLNKIALFTIINNFEILAFTGGCYARAAGTSGVITTKVKKYNN